MFEKKKLQNAIQSDERFKNAKTFSKLNAPISISEEGYIGVVDPKTKKPRIVHIKDVNSFEIVVDGKNVANLGGAIAGGLLFGGIGAIIGGSASKEKITKMNLLLKVNDFNNPTLDIPLVQFEIKKGTNTYNYVQKEIQEIMATLEFIEKKAKE